MHHQPRRPAFLNFWAAVALSLLALAGLTLLLWSPWENRGIAGGRKLVLYCAAGMAKPVAEIARAYQDQFDVEIQPTYDGTGKLLAALRANGGKGDLFLAADAYHMGLACQEGLVAETIPVLTLHPVLVVKTTTQEKLRAKGKPVAALADLLRPDLKVVIANPELASVGQTAKAVLEEARLWDRFAADMAKAGSARVSTVGTVNEVATVVRTRDGYVGVVWDAVALQQPDLEVVRLPEFDRPGRGELVQIGVLRGAEGERVTAALQFARYLAARDRGLPVFKKYQFAPVADADVWAERPELLLSAGSMLKPGLEGAVKEFERREGVRVTTSYNGCGLLVAQMRGLKAAERGGRFPDAYFSCDVSFLEQVQPWFDPGVTVAQNDMVLLVRKGNPKGVQGLEDLARTDLKVGLGHPQNAALGKLTEDLLMRTGLHGRVYGPDAGRVVHADAGHDLVNKVRVGALDLAVVYRSNALANPDNTQYMDVVEVDDPTALATQPFAVAKDSPHRQLARRLLRHVVADASADRFRAIGFRWAYGGGE